MKISEIIETYIKNQEKIDLTNEKLKTLKDNNKQLTDAIINFMENNKKKELVYKDNYFEKKQNKNHSVISQKLLKDSLTKYLDKNSFDKSKIDDLIKFILDCRTTNTKIDLKFKKNN